MASLQAAEALKVIAGQRAKVTRSITVVNLWDNQFEALPLPDRDPDCPCCGQRRFDYLTGTQHSAVTTLCGQGTVQVKPPLGADVDLDELAERLALHGTVQRNRYLLRAELDGVTLTVFGNGRAIIDGVKDAGIARSIYARYVGH